MLGKIELPDFVFGDGAFLEEGTPFSFALGNCEATFWVRAIDGVMLHKLKEAGIDLEDFSPKHKVVQVPVVAEDGSPMIDEETELPLMRPEVQLEESTNQWLSRMTPTFQRFMEMLVVKFEGLKRGNGTPIECTPETIRALGGFPDLIKATVMAGNTAAKIAAGNSESSSDGTSAQTASDGNDISTTAPSEK